MCNDSHHLFREELNSFAVLTHKYTKDISFESCNCELYADNNYTEINFKSASDPDFICNLRIVNYKIFLGFLVLKDDEINIIKNITTEGDLNIYYSSHVATENGKPKFVSCVNDIESNHSCIFVDFNGSSIQIFPTPLVFKKNNVVVETQIRKIQIGGGAYSSNNVSGDVIEEDLVTKKFNNQNEANSWLNDLFP